MIDVTDQKLDLGLLNQELDTAGVPHEGLGTRIEDDRTYLHTYDEFAVPTELPPEAVPVVEAHVPPPRVIEFARQTTVEALARTTDATPLEVFRFPCETRSLYRADLTITGVDAVSFASKIMEGRFTWKRIAGNAIVVGLTVVSDVHDAAAAPWAPNYAPVGTEVVFTVAGAAGRTIDWMLTGNVGRYAPGGLS